MAAKGGKERGDKLSYANRQKPKRIQGEMKGREGKKKREGICLIERVRGSILSSNV